MITSNDIIYSDYTDDCNIDSLNDTYNIEYDSQFFFEESHSVSFDGTYFYYLQDSMLWKNDYTNKTNSLVCMNTDDKNSADFSTIDGKSKVFGNQVYYYNRFLYMIGVENNGKDLSLFQISKDGNVRKRIQKLYSKNDKYTNIEFILHRGYVYFTVSSYQSDCKFLYRKKIGVSDDLQLLYSLKQDISELYRISAYGFNIYFQEIVYTNDYKINRSAIKRYSIIDNSITTILEDVYMDYVIVGNMVYYLDSSTLYGYNMDNHSNKIIYNVNEKCCLSYDGEYLFLDNSFAVNIEEIDLDNREITVLTTDGKVIRNIDTSMYGFCHYGNRDILIFDYASYVNHKFVILDKNNDYNIIYKYEE